MADDNFDDGDDLDYYHDDPDQEINDKPDRKKNIVIGFCASVVLIISAIFYLPSSIGGSIAINTGANKEFGVGVSATTACSGSTPLIVRLGSTNVHTPTPFPTPTNNLKFRLSEIIVSGVPTSCDRKDLIIRAYDSAGIKLALFNSSSSDVYVYKSPLSTFRAGLNSEGLTVTKLTSESFKVTFTGPESNSVDVANISIESASPSMTFTCAVHFECNIGDVGPGGGTVFYLSSLGFNCGVNLTSTCNYLEVAPTLWNGISVDGNGQKWSLTNTKAVPNVETKTSAELTSMASGSIGLGAKNTSSIVTYTGLCDVTANPSTGKTSANQNTTYAACLASAYRGNTKTDWYLPAWSELNQLCKYVTFQFWITDATACNPTLASASGARVVALGLKWRSGWAYWTSTQVTNAVTTAFGLTTNNSIQPPTIGGNKLNWGTGGQLIRPIRAF